MSEESIKAGHPRVIYTLSPNSPEQKTQRLADLFLIDLMESLPLHHQLTGVPATDERGASRTATSQGILGLFTL